MQRIGRLTLNRNPDNFFAETEQVAFHTANIVPGIDFTNDPLLQGRLFSYLDTQLIRLGGPNFHEIPINRPIAPVHNNQRDGFMRQTINRGQSAHEPNNVRGGCPFQAGADLSGFVSYAEKIDAQKIRQRNPRFFDHFSQARLFYRSQTETEKNHIIRALRFELGKVQTPPIRERMLGLLAEVDPGLAESVGQGLGLKVPRTLEQPLNMSRPADVDPKKVQPKRFEQTLESSPALRLIDNPNFPPDTIQTRKVAVLLADGFDDQGVETFMQNLLTAGAIPQIVAPHLGVVTGTSGRELKAEFSFLTASSVLFDAVFIGPGGASVEELSSEPEAREFVQEAYKHCKVIGAAGAAVDYLNAALVEKFGETDKSDGLVFLSAEVRNDGAGKFIRELSKHRHWERERITYPL